MYSRNYTAERQISGIKINSGSASDTSRNIRENIPVRSFSDSFAYDRFNRMGTQPSTISDNYDNNKGKSEERQSFENKEPENQVITDEEKKEIDALDIQKNIQDKTCESVNILSRLKNTFDADTLLIILAVLMLLFSDNATNDKLTPLALHAILFL